MAVGVAVAVAAVSSPIESGESSGGADAADVSGKGGARVGEP